MCTNCQTFPNRSLYRNLDFGQVTNTVPCGMCDECRFVKQSEWSTRLSFDIKQCYSLGGLCVFLTFTYNSAHLPFLNFSFNGLDNSIPCFNRNHVRIFLKRLKKLFYKKYGPARGNGMSGYRYFFVSEQGSTTNRPHYHCLFMLYPLCKNFFKRKGKFVELSFTPRSQWSDFVELCRQIWTTENNFGFTFPNFDKKNNRYYSYNSSTKRVSDDSPLLGHGNETASFLNDFSKAAFYVSKYVCKDLCFFSDVLNDYIRFQKSRLSDEDFSKFSDSLPKHWQSNGIGLSILDDLSGDSAKLSSLTDGVFDPYNHKNVPLPMYCVNHLLYKVLRSDNLLGLANCRISSKSGKILYDRLPSDFGLMYFGKIYEHRVSRVKSKFDEFILNYEQNSRFFDCFFNKVDVHSLINVLSKRFGDLSTAFANYHLYLKKCDIVKLYEYYDDSIFTTDFCKFCYANSKDVIANSWSFFEQESVDTSLIPYPDVVEHLSILHDVFCLYFKNKKRAFYDNSKLHFVNKFNTKAILGLNKYSHF